MNPLLLIAVGWIMMSIAMSILWLIQRRTGDAGIVDVAWGLGVGSLAIFFAMASNGDTSRRSLVATLAMLWAVRLSAYILMRVLRLPEDGRYQTLKEQWGERAQPAMFRFYQLQAIGSVLFALPMLLAVRSEQPLGVIDYLGVAIWVFAIVGESIADWQLSRFRSDPGNRGQVCQVGLWNYSRHPNYFFEWLHWWSYVCFSVSAPLGWLAIFGPICMLIFVLRVTGIPPTEQQAIKSRGEAYRRYQRSTNAFFPWFPKPERAE